jgi:EAL domain-containing protein (putative c-di-GMP-specific phosphodiesterase class I)/CheY-like chemotaxis protein
VSLADCTVLVVEDHEFQRSTTLQILANLGAGSLLEAADGEDALTMFGFGRQPDVIVCDLDMPGMDGIEFLRRVAERAAGTAVIIASGLDEDVLRAAEATARGYGLVVLGAIPKPLTARRLLQAVGLHRPGVAAVAASAGSPAADPWGAALERELIGVRVRPRVELASGRLGGLEVRAHRLSPDGEIDAAADPLGPAAGAAALAVAERVFRAGLTAQQRLSDGGDLVDVTLVVPAAALAGEEGAQAHLLERLSALAAEAEVEPARICVSVPDAEGAAAALDLLTRLRVRGFGLGFDGFGGVRGTLPALERLPLTEVKIDGDALGRATASVRGAEAFAATVQLLHDRGLDVVCDGCSSSAEWLVALQAGCWRAQGAFVGPPLAAEDVTAWLQTWEGVR